MGNCLKTTLKANVNNPDLPYFGAASIILDPSYTGCSFKVNPGQTAKLISKADGTVFNLSDSQDIKSSDLSGRTEFMFVSKYSAFPCNGSADRVGAFMKTDMSQWKNFESLEQINIRAGINLNLKVSDLPSSNVLGMLNLYQTPLTGTLSALLAKYPNVGKNNSSINLYSVGNTFTGNVSDLSVLKYTPSSLCLEGSIGGDFYDAIVGWRTNIGQTGTIPEVYCGAGVHLWSVYPGAETIFKISWTATTSSITVGGVTTTFDNSGNII